MHPFYPALLMLLPLALAAPNKPRRSAEERLDAVESLARHALARLDDLEERVTKMEQPTTTMKDEIAAVRTVVAAAVKSAATSPSLRTGGNSMPSLLAAGVSTMAQRPLANRWQPQRAAVNSNELVRGQIILSPWSLTSEWYGSGAAQKANHRRRSRLAACKTLASGETRPIAHRVRT